MYICTLLPKKKGGQEEGPHTHKSIPGLVKGNQNSTTTTATKQKNQNQKKTIANTINNSPFTVSYIYPILFYSISFFIFIFPFLSVSSSLRQPN
jgi:hypothetical protein